MKDLLSVEFAHKRELTDALAAHKTRQLNGLTCPQSCPVCDRAFKTNVKD